MPFEQYELDEAVVTLPTPEMPWNFNVKFNSPVSKKENFKLCLQHKGLWMPTTRDKMWFCPREIPDNIARAFVVEGERFNGPVGGKDMFGVSWEYVPSARGSIVRPGNPTLTDISVWKDVIHFPDINSWDWESGLERNRTFLENADTLVNFTVYTGWFERLISFMDFGPAALALMGRKTKGHVKELFERITDLWIELINKAHETYGGLIDGFAFHDDWGAQDSPFFNERTVREMIVPYMKRVTDRLHDLGYSAELHSCGKIEKLVGCIVDAGWDSWDGMNINDYHQLYPVYGNRLMLSVSPDSIPAPGDTEVSLKAADDFVKEFGNPDAPAMISLRFDGEPNLDYIFEIYKQSRIAYEG